MRRLPSNVIVGTLSAEDVGETRKEKRDRRKRKRDRFVKEREKRGEKREEDYDS